MGIHEKGFQGSLFEVDFPCWSTGPSRCSFSNRVNGNEGSGRVATMGRILGPCILFALLGVSIGACEPKEPNIKVTIVVILASDQGEKSDPRLKAIAEEIKTLNPQLKSFKLHSMMSKSLPPNQKHAFELVDKQKATIVVTRGADENNKVSLTVGAPNQGEIDYRSACGKFLPIVTRYSTKSNERLILAIRVQPCNGD